MKALTCFLCSVILKTDWNYLCGLENTPFCPNTQILPRHLKTISPCQALNLPQNHNKHSESRWAQGWRAGVGQWWYREFEISCSCHQKKHTYSIHEHTSVHWLKKHSKINHSEQHSYSNTSHPSEGKHNGQHCAALLTAPRGQK